MAFYQKLLYETPSNFGLTALLKLIRRFIQWRVASVGLTLQWYNDEKTIIYQSNDGDWTWDEFHAQQVLVNQMIESIHHRVDIIMDTLPNKTGKIPPNAALHFRNAIRNRHPNAGLLIIVGVHPLIQVMVNVVRAVTRSNTIAIAISMERALALIERENSRIPG